MIKVIVTSILLIAQMVANVGFIYLYDSNGTFFEWAMMNQRDDAFGTIEELSLRWSMLILLIVLFGLYIVGMILILIQKNTHRHK